MRSLSSSAKTVPLSRDLPSDLSAGLDDLIQRQAVLAELGIDESKVALNSHAAGGQQQAARRLNRHELALANPKLRAYDCTTLTARLPCLGRLPTMQQNHDTLELTR
jgi:hypothetical protein